MVSLSQWRQNLFGAPKIEGYIKCMIMRPYLRKRYVWPWSWRLTWRKWVGGGTYFLISYADHTHYRSWQCHHRKWAMMCVRVRVCVVMSAHVTNTLNNYLSPIYLRPSCNTLYNYSRSVLNNRCEVIAVERNDLLVK